MKPKYSKSADKYLNAQNKTTRDRIKDAVKKIPEGDIKPMEGYTDGSCRLRVGKYRIVFVMEGKTPCVREIGSRGDIYK
jgi:mRNA interferase RelE/StbE